MHPRLQNALLGSVLISANVALYFLWSWVSTETLFVLAAALAMSGWYGVQRLHRHRMTALAQSHAALEKKYQALLQSHAHKEEFMAAVGHELRTPMNAILGLNGVLRKALSRNPADTEIVDHIRSATEQLLQVVNDLLDFSQLQAGRLTLNEHVFEIQHTLQTLLTEYQEAANKKGVALVLNVSIDSPMWVKADRQRLEQVLKNLIDNALRFTSAGRIQLSVRSVGTDVVFEVQDTGVGMSVQTQQQLFQRFDAADVPSHRLNGSTGLGLAICERLVKLQGGTLGVSSALGQGARFWFQLPLHPLASHEGEGAIAEAPDVSHHALNILLVDDNAVNRMVARMMLKKCFPNASLVEASSGGEALDQFHNHDFDVVLMDVIMPVMTGMQATVAIRQTLPPPKCHTPVLALTASADSVDAQQCLASGMNEVLQKPLVESQVMTKITAALAAHAQQGHA